MKERISLQIKNIREDEREVITRVPSTIKLYRLVKSYLSYSLQFVQ